MDVSNKVCIITGSSQGLGKEFARILLDHGAKVCLSDLQEEESGGEKSATTFTEFRNLYGAENVFYVKCDVTKEKEFVALFDGAEKHFQVDCVDMLVNNAGINTNFGWRKCMEVNIIGVMTGTDIALKRMKQAAKKGAIINTASMAGFTTGMGERAIGYSASKHGVVALTRTLATDYKYHGVSIKAICPAWTDTEIVSSALEQAPQDRVPQFKNSIKKSGGLMTAEYVAEGFYKLATECGNGTILSVLKDTPYFVVPDDANIKVLFLAIMAKLIGKLTGNNLVTANQLAIGLVLVLVIMIFLINMLF